MKAPSLRLAVLPAAHRQGVAVSASCGKASRVDSRTRWTEPPQPIRQTDNLTQVFLGQVDAGEGDDAE